MSSWTTRCRADAASGVASSSCARARAATGRPTCCAWSAPADRGVPAGFDVPLSAAPFSFTVDCPSDLDCRAADDPPPLPLGDPAAGDYLARDYEALRTRLLDRLATLLPRLDRPQPRRPGRHARRALRRRSATGSRTGRTRSRSRPTSAPRGAARRCAGTPGCSTTPCTRAARRARGWPSRTTPTSTLPRRHARGGRRAAAGGRGAAGRACEAGGTVFETVADARPAAGAQRAPAARLGRPGARACPPAPPAPSSRARAGADPGLLAGRRPRPRGPARCRTGRPAGGPVEAGDPAAAARSGSTATPGPHRPARADAAPCSSCAGGPHDALAGAAAVTEPAAAAGRSPVAVALANVVARRPRRVARRRAARTRRSPPPDRPYRPRLPRDRRRVRRPGRPSASPAPAARPPSLARPDPRRPAPRLDLDDGERTWTPQPDLLAAAGSTRTSSSSRSPTAASGCASATASPGARPTAGTIRGALPVGGGRGGQRRRRPLTRLLPRADGATPVAAGASLDVWNPLPATGGTDPERLEQVRQLAPHAFRQQLRAVTPGRLRRRRRADPGVQRAVAGAGGPAPGTRRRSPSTRWPRHGRPDACPVTAVLEVRRMAGIDVELAPPVYVPLLGRAVRLPGPRLPAGDVEARLRDVLSAAARCPAAGAASSTPTASRSASRSAVATSSPRRWPSPAWPGSTSPRFARLAALRRRRRRRARGRRDRRRGPRGAALRQRPEQPRGGPRRDRSGGWRDDRRAARSASAAATPPRTRPASPSCTGAPRRTALALARMRALARRPRLTTLALRGLAGAGTDEPASRCSTPGPSSPTPCPSTPSGSRRRASCARRPSAGRCASSPARSATSCAPASPPRPSWRSTSETAAGAPEVAIVPAGTPVQSVPGPGELPQTFETSADLEVAPAWNAHRRARLPAADDRARTTTVWVRGPDDRPTGGRASSSRSRPLPSGHAGAPDPRRAAHGHRPDAAAHPGWTRLDLDEPVVPADDPSADLPAHRRPGARVPRTAAAVRLERAGPDPARHARQDPARWRRSTRTTPLRTSGRTTP